VIDFGKLKFLRQWIEKNLDHACLFNADDPIREQLVAAEPTVWKCYIVENCSCEGLAQHLFSIFDPMVREHSGGRVWVLSVEVHEDARNSALFAPPSSSVTLE
jgi:6-pyruvoyltetrahydropterin/6-carboxytetrahydropterin synthase